MTPPGRKILHVDMDAFYASVEQRDDPRLRGKPLAVGGSARRGVVLAASYEARPFGVRSAMPMARALRLCPHLLVVPPHFDRYAEASEKVFEIFHEFTPEVEGLSLDEAFLDITRSIALFGPAEEQAAKIKARIRERLGLTASVGIAEVKFAAKVASDLRKPDGLVVVPEGGVQEFLAPLPVSRLWGVGPKTEKVVVDLGLRTIGDVARADEAWLTRELGSLGPWLLALARGIDPRPVEPDREAKSIGAEETFEDDLSGEDLHPFLHGQSLRVAARLRRAGLRARVVHLKVKSSTFRITTRQRTLREPTNDGAILYDVVRELLGHVPPGLVRLTGVHASGLVAQLPLPDGQADRRSRLNASLDKIHERFGDDAVLTADLISNRK
ncbi:MAG: DNA polymerase IV [Myxococcales bacterium]